jgi:hypothetical protein
VWESDTELDGLVLRKTRLPEERGEEEEERGEGEEEEPRGEVIRGKGERPKEKEGTKNVRYKQRSKYVISLMLKYLWYSSRLPTAGLARSLTNSYQAIYK